MDRQCIEDNIIILYLFTSFTDYFFYTVNSLLWWVATHSRTDAVLIIILWLIYPRIHTVIRKVIGSQFIFEWYCDKSKWVFNNIQTYNRILLSRIKLLKGTRLGPVELVQYIIIKLIMNIFWRYEDASEPWSLEVKVINTFMLFNYKVLTIYIH